MSQLTIYLPDEVEARARRAAEASNQSMSRWIAQRLQRDLDESWPAEVIQAAGAFSDFPSLEELRSGYGEDVPREPLA